MKELDNGARIWCAFNDETDRIDGQLIAGWIASLDLLLIFVSRSAQVHRCFFQVDSFLCRPVFSLRSLRLSSSSPPRTYNRITRRSRLLSLRK